ncbi:MAG: hypothetical protein OJF49_003234 [Ktedonobacterales bacterium]|jgi:hypothetical protein|nr:MAG: hypothetical protein OJF49_003234 [Ktedonobacterales bacterium]
MAATLGLSAYIDVPTYLRSPVNQETVTLLGLNTTLSAGSTPAGTTALGVVSSTGWAVGTAWLLDGPYSEIVTITGSADGTHVTLAAPGTQFAHGLGASISQAGTAGSLAETLLRASAWVENYCQQGTGGGDRSLYAVARTERWGMPSTRAYIDRDNVVAVMPGHFPVQSVSALSIEFGQGQSLSLDVSQLEEMTVGRMVEVPYLLAGGPTVGQQLFLDTVGLSRTRRQWAVLSYVGGITPGSIPYDVQQAAALIASEVLGQRRNPTGAAEYKLGKLDVVQRQRGDAVGDSILLLRARDLLQPYRSEVW